MLFKCFEDSTVALVEAAVNVWLATGNFFVYSQAFNMVPDGGGGENVCLMIFYTQKT